MEYLPFIPRKAFDHSIVLKITILIIPDDRVAKQR